MNYAALYDKKSKLIPALISLTTMLVIWELGARYSGWSAQVLPGPTKVFGSFVEVLFNGTLFQHCIASLFRVTAGFYLAMILAIPLGILIGRLKTLNAAINPVIQFLRPISPLAWIPLAMLWFGIGDKPAVFLIFLASFFPLVLSTAIAVNSINPVYFLVAHNFNFTTTEKIKKIIIPAIIPDVLTALRITVSIAWIVVVAAEMIAVKSGLGYLIIDSRNALRMDYVMVGMITIGVIGILLDMLMLELRKLNPVPGNFA